MHEQRQDDQLEPLYNRSESILDVTLKTSWERWKIGTNGEKGSEGSVMAAQHDHDDDDVHNLICICISNIDRSIKKLSWKKKLEAAHIQQKI